MEPYVENKRFEKLSFTDKPLEKAEYEYCTFSGCDFSNSDLSGVVFSECDFVGCNLSMVKLMGTAFRKVVFRDCKLLGVNFENCNNFGMELHFDSCVIKHSVFYKLKIRKTIFKNTQLHETDFTECDLTNSVFKNCDLTGATFDHSILERVDFTTAANLILDPEFNRIKKARFSMENIPGLLTKYDIVIER